jgi:hypothetical protein
MGSLGPEGVHRTLGDSVLSLPTCRRCSECIGCEHHWIDNYDAADETDATHACKHCDVLGDECETCDGEGGRTSPDGYPLALCPPCGGHGVIARLPTPVPTTEEPER